MSYVFFFIAAQEALSGDAADEGSGSEEGDDSEHSGPSKSQVSAECGECIAAVGQAVWNCGTLELECIKNSMEAGSGKTFILITHFFVYEHVCSFKNATAVCARSLTYGGPTMRPTASRRRSAKSPRKLTKSTEPAVVIARIR